MAHPLFDVSHAYFVLRDTIRTSFGCKVLYQRSGGLVPTHDPTGEIPLDTVTGKPSIDVLAVMQKSWSLMVNATVERADRIVGGDHAFEVHREIRTLSQVISINGVDVVPAIGPTNGARQRLVDIGLRSQVPCVCVWVNDAGGRHANIWIDIDTIIEVRGKKWPSQVPRSHNDARLCIDLVHIVLRGCDEDVLDTI